MQIIYSDMAIPETLPFKSVFLAGPTPRDPETPSWRPEAIEIFKSLNFTGAIFYPEWSTPQAKMDYDSQVEWEHEGLTRCLWRLFWVPRELKSMPAFTTNVEFGRFAHDSCTVYGRPDDAPKNRYLDWYYKKVNPNRPIFNNLREMIEYIV